MRNDQDDEAAIGRVLKGDTAAFVGIVTWWQGPLVNLAHRFCRERGVVEDLAQEAFLRAFRNLGSWHRILHVAVRLGDERVSGRDAAVQAGTGCARRRHGSGRKGG